MSNSAIPIHETEHGVEDTALSALADGELDHQDTMRLLETLSHRADWRARWQSYHIIGDCLRDTPPLKSDLATRISLLLADEPTILAPRRRSLTTRFGMPAAASLAAMVLVAWGVINFNQRASLPLSANQMAAANTAQLSADARRDVNGYVVAHRDFSPGAMIANAAFEVPSEPAQ